MNFAYNLNGSSDRIDTDVPISNTYAIKAGQAVSLIQGHANLSTMDFIGIASETHSGEKDIFNPRSNGDKIRVTVSPSAVYKTNAPKISFLSSADSQTATVTTGQLFDYTIADLNGGLLVCSSKSVGSTNTDAIGDVRKIIAYTSGTFTLSEGGKIGTGDVYSFIPKLGFKKLRLGSNYDDVALDQTKTDFMVVGQDVIAGKIFVVINNHYFNS